MEWTYDVDEVSEFCCILQHANVLRNLQAVNKYYNDPRAYNDTHLLWIEHSKPYKGDEDWDEFITAMQSVAA